MKRVSFAQAFLDRCNFAANEDDKQQNKKKVGKKKWSFKR